MFFALVVCALVVGAPLNADQHQALMETYNSLGAFAKPLFSFSFFFFFFFFFLTLGVGLVRLPWGALPSLRRQRHVQRRAVGV